MIKRLLTIFLLIFFLTVSASANYMSDLIVTGTSGIWTDSRSYGTLNDAITAIGASDQDLYIVEPETVTTLTIPANIRLHFLKNGSIANSGQLNINTKQIFAGDRQIFTGTGDIDFCNGSVVRSTWFSDIVEAFDQTYDDNLTLVISKPAFITDNCQVGNNVNLRWEAPRTQLTINSGYTLSNIKSIEAGNFQLFAGAGDFDFLDGAELKLNWFQRLRSVLTWIESEEVTVIVNENSIVDYTQASTANETIKILPGGMLSPSAGITLTLAGPFECGLQQAFSGTGTIKFGYGTPIEYICPHWWRLTSDSSQTDQSAASSNSAALTAALSALAYSGNSALDGRYSKIFVPQGFYWIDSPMILKCGQTIQGASPGPGLYGTAFKLADGSNCNMMESLDYHTHANWCHQVNVQDITLDGNKANNATGHGVAVYKMGQFSTFRRIFVKDCAEDGFRIEGGMAGGRGFVSCESYRNDGYGFNFVDVDGSLEVINPTLEYNISGAIKIVFSSGDGQIRFTNMHMEGVQGPPAVEVSGSGILVLDGCRVTAGIAGNTIEITGGYPTIVAIGLSGIIASVEDTVNAVTFVPTCRNWVYRDDYSNGYGMQFFSHVSFGKLNEINFEDSTGDINAVRLKLRGTDFFDFVVPSRFYLNSGGSEVLLASNAGLQLGNVASTAISGHYSRTKTWNPPNVANGARTTTTVTATHAVVGDPTCVGFSQDLQGMILTGYVSAADTATVVLYNNTGGALDLASGTLRVDVWQH